MRDKRERMRDETKEMGGEVGGSRWELDWGSRSEGIGMRDEG
jgi:hypothetical protein